MPVPPAAPDDPIALRREAQEAAAQGRTLDALRAYDRLVDLDEADARIWREMASLLSDLGEYAQSLGAFGESLKQFPDGVEALNDLARSLYHLGQADEAASQLRRAVALSDSPEMWRNLAVMIPGCPKASLEDVLAVRTSYARRQAEFLGPRSQPKARRQKQQGPPRVGYLSSFFHAPNYMKPVWGLINQHDRRSVNVVLLSDSDPEKGMTGYRPDAADAIYLVAKLDNRQLAEQINALDLDVLVDLNSYSVPRRLGLFFEPLAPATAAWFNAFATSGLPGVGYMIGDDEVIRPGEESQFTEKIVRLPLSYLTFEVSHPCPPVAAPPCASGNGLTFGSLVTQYKITPPVLDAWARILQQSPKSRLLMANSALKSAENREFVRQRFASRGIAADRLELQGPAAHYAYLQNYDRIDVALDAFPYNGGTTTMEALWQGVPVLTFDGDRWASRTSQTLIRRTPCHEFVRTDVEDYVATAVELANDPATPDRLVTLRRDLRERLAASSACDTREMARAMEAIYDRLAATDPTA